MSPLNILKLEDYHVTMLRRNGPARSFGAGFLAVGHTALRPYVKLAANIVAIFYGRSYVKIEQSLNQQEYKEWEDKLDSL